MKLGHILWSGTVKLAKSRLLTSLPLFTYLLLSSVYFLTVLRLADGPGSYPLYWVSTSIENEAVKYAAELLKQKFQFAGYGLTLVLILFRLREFLSFWWVERTLLFVFSVLLLTTLVSDNPVRVVINVMHLVFGAIAVWLYFAHESRRRNPVHSAAFIMFCSLVFVQAVSIIWFFAHPDGTIDSILAGRRQGGIAGNPNTFGGVCIASAWATLTLIFVQQKHRLKSMLWLIPIGVVSFNAWSTGSATTLGVMAVVCVLFLVRSAYGRFDRKKRSILVFVATAAFFGLAFWLVIQQNLLDYAGDAADSVGKDLTFTGRVDLWIIALEAIAERPILGWSYDNHETVQANPLYTQPFNHFHNGFLDTLIVGGVLFGLAVLVNFYSFALRAYRISAKGIYVFPLVVGVIAACMQNMTEYSMFRNNSVVWMLYFICFVCAAIQFSSDAKTAKRASPRPAPKSSARRRTRRSRRSSGYSW